MVAVGVLALPGNAAATHGGPDCTSPNSGFVAFEVRNPQVSADRSRILVVPVEHPVMALAAGYVDLSKDAQRDPEACPDPDSPPDDGANSGQCLGVAGQPQTYRDWVPRIGPDPICGGSSRNDSDDSMPDGLLPPVVGTEFAA
jgi:hypothetical protein